jgi:hypothetical protein
MSKSKIEKPRPVRPLDAPAASKKTSPAMSEDRHDPEADASPETLDLAHEQSISARNLIYNPGKMPMDVIKKCAHGINAVMNRLSTEGKDEATALANNEILISMCTRLMIEGGNQPIPGFRNDLEKLGVLSKTNPRSEEQEAEYKYGVRELATKCRREMSQMLTDCQREGPAGGRGRQALLGFLGDLGGLEPHNEVQFGGYPAPLGSGTRIYSAYVDGVCDLNHPPSTNPDPNVIARFPDEFEAARLRGVAKGGGTLGTDQFTKYKPDERVINLAEGPRERKGLLDQGTRADNTMRIPEEQRLRNATWPSFRTARAVTEGLLEPVSGHVSGTAGEMIHTMRLLCGESPNHIKGPSAPTEESLARMNRYERDQSTAIASLTAAGLIATGFHTAVEVWQPISTYTGSGAEKLMGPGAIEEMVLTAKNLETAAEGILAKPGDPSTAERQEELKTAAQMKKESARLMEEASMCHDALKAVGMGTMATTDVSRLMDKHSANMLQVTAFHSQSFRNDVRAQSGRTLDAGAVPFVPSSPRTPLSPTSTANSEVATHKTTTEEYRLIMAQGRKKLNPEMPNDEQQVEDDQAENQEEHGMR